MVKHLIIYLYDLCIKCDGRFLTVFLKHYGVLSNRLAPRLNRSRLCFPPRCCLDPVQMGGEGGNQWPRIGRGTVNTGCAGDSNSHCNNTRLEGRQCWAAFIYLALPAPPASALAAGLRRGPAIPRRGYKVLPARGRAHPAQLDWKHPSGFRSGNRLGGVLNEGVGQ